MNGETRCNDGKIKKCADGKWGNEQNCKNDASCQDEFSCGSCTNNDSASICENDDDGVGWKKKCANGQLVDEGKEECLENEKPASCKEFECGKCLNGNRIIEDDIIKECQNGNYVPLTDEEETACVAVVETNNDGIDETNFYVYVNGKTEDETIKAQKKERCSSCSSDSKLCEDCNNLSQPICINDADRIGITQTCSEFGTIIEKSCGDGTEKYSCNSEFTNCGVCKNETSECFFNDTTLGVCINGEWNYSVCPFGCDETTNPKQCKTSSTSSVLTIGNLYCLDGKMKMWIGDEFEEVYKCNSEKCKDETQCESPKVCSSLDSYPKCQNNSSTKIGYKITCESGYEVIDSCNDASCNGDECGECINGAQGCYDQKEIGNSWPYIYTCDGGIYKWVNKTTNACDQKKCETCNETPTETYPRINPNNPNIPFIQP